MSAAVQGPLVAKVLGRLATADRDGRAIPDADGFEALASAISLRLKAAGHAAGEIEALVKVVRREATDGSVERLQTVLPGMLKRILDLNSVVLSVVDGDCGRSTLDMFQVVCADAERAAEIVSQGAGS